MQLQLPRTAEVSSLRVTLDDGRIAVIDGSGRVCVYRPETHGLGSENYSLMLPDVQYVADHCDQRDVKPYPMRQGRVMIPVEHRH